jgi:uncharacterized protein YaeQ
MASNATIFKVDLQIADIDRNYYATHALTIARHPSETDERMMVRLLAFARHADDALAFGKGLSSDDEPDLWRKDLTGLIQTWIEIGQPDDKRIRRASGRADQVIVYTYSGRGADIWWQQNAAVLDRVGNLSVVHFARESLQTLAGHAERSMQMQCTIHEGDFSIVLGGENIPIHTTTVKSSEKSRYA